MQINSKMNSLFVNYQHNGQYFQLQVSKRQCYQILLLTFLRSQGTTQGGLLGRKGTIEIMRPGLFVF